jgi:phospholipid/cholesterol/gamma-HCH transport system substrate-binding protein
MNIKLKKEVKVTLVFFVTLLLFIWGVNFLKGTDLFSSKRKFYAVYDNIDGLMVANPVQINGLKVGIVSKIDFAEDNSGKIEVELTIDNSIGIPKNSVAEIASPDLLGGKVVRIILGSGPMAENKDRFTGRVQLAMTDKMLAEINPIKLKAESMISSLDTILLSVKSVFNAQNQQNLATSFNHIQLTLEHLSSTMETIDYAVSGNKNNISEFIKSLSEITKNINNNNKKITNIIENFSSISDTLAKANFAQTIKSTEKAISDFQVMLDKVNRGEGSLGQLANNDTLYFNLQKSSASLDALLKDLKAHPKRYIHFSVFGKKEKKDTVK